jgi:hypothetical protein
MPVGITLLSPKKELNENTAVLLNILQSNGIPLKGYGSGAFISEDRIQLLIGPKF